MKFIKTLKLFKESVENKKKTYNSKNLISEICVSMVLLNNTFLDNLLDRNQKARYSENSSVFIEDLKNLLMSKNRLCLGKFEGNRCVEDSEISKINGIFNEGIEFTIEDDWNTLINARITARNIIDKVNPDEKLQAEKIAKIFWIGPNKNKQDGDEDIVIEMVDGMQYSFYLNKNLSSKTSSFSLLAEEFIGTETDYLYKNDYLLKWDKLVQNWVKVIYENANTDIKSQIEKFIESGKIMSLHWFDYFNIKHGGDNFKHLGEYIKQFDKNVLYLSDLMSLIWKNREDCFMDPNRVYEEWTRIKQKELNARILEHILTDSLTRNYGQEIKKLSDGFKSASGKLKMRVTKIIVNKLGCKERTVYYLSNNGNNFYQIPSRAFFRKNFNNLGAEFDYHVKLNQPITPETNNDFGITLKLNFNDKKFINCLIDIKFSGGDISDKLSAKFNFDFSDDFNIVAAKNTESPKDKEE